MDYFIGIDFGHGDTAAWAVSMNGNDEGKCLRIDFTKDANDPEKSKRPSAVFRRHNEFFLANREGGVVIPYFKGRYSNINSSKKAEAFSNYIRLIVQEIIENHKDNKDLQLNNKYPYNFKLFIACPLLWSPEERINYKEFVNHSLEDLNIQVEWVIGESDAAFFTQYEQARESCVLVIDFGSSTIDYTLIVDGIKASDDTWSNNQLGASNIEENMYQFFIHDKVIGGELQKYKQEMIDAGESEFAANIPDDLKYCCREAKEDSFTSKIYYNDNGKMKSKVYGDSIILKGNLKEMMGDYPKEVREEFNSLRKRVFGELKRRGQNKLDLVILSGGAFTMKWLVNMAKEVFNNSDVQKDPYPSYVVAKGIALYARKQHQALQDLLKGLDVIPNQDIAIQNFFGGSIFLQPYLADKDVISYEQIFKDADTYARNRMIVSGFKKKMESILDNSKATRTGEYIRQQVIEYLKTFMISTPEQEKEFEDFFNQQLNNRIVKEFESTILDHFGKKLTDHDKKKIIIHIKMEPFVLKEDNFIEGGTYHIGGGGYMEIDNLLNIALKHASGDICHIDMNKVRTPDHFRNIVNEFIPLYEEHLSQGTYNYNQKELEKTVSEIKKQVKEQAEKLFYDPDIQLFETTYKA